MRSLRREYGREGEPFAIMLALLEPPSPDLYERAEDAGVTAVMCIPWMGMDLAGGGGVERYKGPHRKVRRDHHREVRKN